MSHQDWIFRVETTGEYIEQYGFNTNGLWIRTTPEKANALIVQGYTQDEVHVLQKSLLSEHPTIGALQAEVLE